MQQAHISLVDDIDGTEATETVAFMLDGAEYVIDLNDGHAGDLREELRRYVEKARRTGGRETRRPRAVAGTRVTGLAPVAVPTEAARVREWAAMRGIHVNPQGRIRADIIDQYHREQATPKAKPAAAKPVGRRRGRATVAVSV